MYRLEGDCSGIELRPLGSLRWIRTITISRNGGALYQLSYKGLQLLYYAPGEGFEPPT